MIAILGRKRKRKTMWNMWIHEFEVEGSGPFPTDMLRHDECYPKNSESASQIALSYSPGSEGETRKIILKHLNRYKHWKPDREQWKSFGWKVMERFVTKV